MKSNNLNNKLLNDRKIAMFISDGFDELQLFSSKKALEKVGAKVVIISLHSEEIKSWDIDHWGKSVRADTTIDDSSAEEFDALILPGGKWNTSILCQDIKTVNFFKDFDNDGKVIA